MIVSVQSKQTKYVYPEVEGAKILVDVEHGNLLVQRQYKNDVQRVKLFDRGTWDKVNFS